MKFLFFFLLIAVFANANDGVYYGSGNHLIPIVETEISITKEILTIRKVNNRLIEVEVYYEFFNPKASKKITVGFEALSPYGDVNQMPKKGKHPYMHDFTVILNESPLSYQVAYVHDSLYVKNGKITSDKLNHIEKQLQESFEADFFYVYYFQADFKKGKNVIRHKYTYDVSNSVMHNFNFEYVLTAANRWKNGRIGDFTLILDLGEFESFNLRKSFFKNISDWQVEGRVKTQDILKDEERLIDYDALLFHSEKGKLIFHKQNFRPEGELYIYSDNFIASDGEYFDPENDRLPYSIHQQERLPAARDEKGLKILRNLPFARRGYVFDSPELQEYFEKHTDWYQADPAYKPELGSLTLVEREWVMRLNK